MKKQDFIVIGILFALWLAWPYVDREVIRKIWPGEVSAPAGVVSTSSVPEIASTEPAADSGAPPEVLQEPPALVSSNATDGTDAPEQTAILSNEWVEITLTSRGAGVADVLLKRYPRSMQAGSAPVELDFSSAPALACVGWKDFEGRSFGMTVVEEGQSVRFSRTSAGGVEWTRTISLATNAYQMNVEDRLRNVGAADLTVPAHGVSVGPMRNLPGDREDSGLINLGFDVLVSGGEGVKYFSKSIPKWFASERESRGLSKLPVRIEWPTGKPADWIAAKNRYFAQILVPPQGVEYSGVVDAVRDLDPREVADPAFSPKMTRVIEVGGFLRVPAMPLAVGETISRDSKYYVGPKQFTELNRFGLNQVDVMEFGFWKPIGKILLVVLIWIHGFVWPHNYGVAIILLTVLIRVLFWPITRKSTESMKRMQEIQPLVNELRAKFKDNPQKQQQAIMQLYKEHKVNPLGGCLPLVIQIPVFIALFVVLRSAIELRFASFLWVRDLSQPERLFADVLPIPINILPIIMAATMAWQQHLTPSSGDPAQKKIMMFMPVMMLFFFYNFPAGLSLYWTTNQCLMIIQMLNQRRRKAAAAKTAVVRSAGR